MHGKSLLLIALGGALGAPARALFAGAFASTSLGRPLGTLMVNLLGSLVLGSLAAWTGRSQETPLWITSLLMIGFLGSFTTFSTFAVEVVESFEQKGALHGLLHALLSLLACLLAAVLGAALTRAASA